jgi:hypothetical protein
MKSKNLTAAALAFAALNMLGGAASADVPRTVTCANGRTVQASGTESDAAACLTIGSQPSTESKGPGAKYNDITLKKGANYQKLAAAHKPRTPAQEQLIKQYMKLPPAQRPGFKAAHPEVQKSIWDLGPYAVCFYASVAGGADVVEAGDECHDEWVN